jgi:hypothetical protein
MSRSCAGAFLVAGCLEVAGSSADLVVEVISPNDEVEDFEAKLFDYRQAGIPHLVVYPEPVPPRSLRHRPL